MSRKNGGILSRIFSKRAKPVHQQTIYKYKDGAVFAITIEDGKIIKEEKI